MTLVLALGRIDEGYGVLGDSLLVYRFGPQTLRLHRFLLLVGLSCFELGLVDVFELFLSKFANNDAFQS